MATQMATHECNHHPESRSSPYPMLNVSDALDIILSKAQVLEKETRPVASAASFILAQTIQSQVNVPPSRTSIMDGYAVIASDGMGTFPVQTRITAGMDTRESKKDLEPGSCAYICTGAPVPPGATAVIKIEDTLAVSDKCDGVEQSVEIKLAAAPGQYIRPRGSDIAQGQEVLAAGELLSAAEIGLLAMVGQGTVDVIRKPRVGVLSTGNELFEFDTRVQNQNHIDSVIIRDSNRPMILSALTELQFPTRDCGICKDEPEALERRVSEALAEVDVLITSGGVSMGEHDFLKALLCKLGTIHFGRVRMKPGKPTTFATVTTTAGKTKLVFGLPGNPVSAYVALHLFVFPALKAQSGFPLANCCLAPVQVQLGNTLALDQERTEYHRAHVVYDVQSHVFRAFSTGYQASCRLLSCRQANALLILPRGSGVLSERSTVSALFVGKIPSTTTGKIMTESVPTSKPKSKQRSICSQALTSAIRACVLTVSDSCARGEHTDLSGPTCQTFLETELGMLCSVTNVAIVPDTIGDIQNQIREWCDESSPNIIITTGGTGFSPRDVTPEAVSPLLTKNAPGLVHAMLQASLAVTDKAMLSRPVAGIRHQTLIVTVPGRPKAVIENLRAIRSVLPHALAVLRKDEKTPP